MFSGGDVLHGMDVAVRGFCPVVCSSAQHTAYWNRCYIDLHVVHGASFFYVFGGREADIDTADSFSELPGGHISSLCCVCICSQCHRTVSLRRCFPSIHKPDVYQCSSPICLFFFSLANLLKLCSLDLRRIQMGLNWGSTLIGCISLILCPIPFFFHKYGAKIRQRSRFAPCKVSTRRILRRVVS